MTARGPWQRRTATAIAAVVLVVVGISAVGYAAAEPASGAGAPAGSSGTLGAATPPRDVTLLTGDRVHVSTDSTGRSAVTVTPAPRADGSHPSFWVSQHGADLTVVPQDVATLLPARLDPGLFDVTSLLEQGDGDAQNSSIPLIVTYRGAPTAVPAATESRRLASVHGAGMRVRKTSAAELGNALITLANAADARSAVAGPLAGVDKIWLDARVRVAVDDNLTQIGAPEVWAHGFDGSGISVAVLDTGIDATHPDLAGAVAAAQNFTTAADVSDHFGHGTHVASIIAGRGTASGGEHKGVAYAASLLNGKVLDDRGTGFA